MAVKTVCVHVHITTTHYLSEDRVISTRLNNFKSCTAFDIEVEM